MAAETAASARAARATTKRPDDLASNRHRLLIGASGAATPFALYIVAAWRPTSGLPRYAFLGSLSAYYYTGAVAVFVGFLVALAAFLITYRGYRNEYGTWDKVMAWTAAGGALAVAFFPTDPPNGLTGPDWWHLWVGYVHGVGAAAMFISFTAFALWLFRQSGQQVKDRGKQARNVVYLVCGIIMVGCLVATPVVGFAGGRIVWLEFIAWECFAICWLVKGRVDQMARSALGAVSKARI